MTWHRYACSCKGGSPIWGQTNQIRQDRRMIGAANRPYTRKLSFSYFYPPGDKQIRSTA